MTRKAKRRIHQVGGLQQIRKSVPWTRIFCIIGSHPALIERMNCIISTTKFERQHFESSPIRVNRNNLDLLACIGRHLTDQEIVELSGAPAGSTVHLVLKQRWSEDELQGEPVPPGVYFVVESDTYLRSSNCIGIFRVSEQNFGIYIKWVDFFPKKFPGIAARMVARIVRCAWDMRDVIDLRLYAEGGRSSPDLVKATGERWGGYAAWPAYGFDMELLSTTRALIRKYPYYPRGLSICRRVSDVLNLTGGWEFWKLAGDGELMQFDLAPYSASVQRLNAYLASKNL